MHTLSIELEKKLWSAAILSTYDDLIENNTRRIKILERDGADDLPRVVRQLQLSGA